MLAALAKASQTPGLRYVHVARLCHNSNMVAEAWNALHHAMSLDPQDPRPHHWAAHFAQLQGNTREARVHLLRCARLGGWSVESYETIGVCHGSKLDPEILVDRILEASPNPCYGAIHVNVSYWLAAAGERQCAREELKKMLALDPTFTPYAAARGRMDFLWGNYRRAERWLRRGLECIPQHPQSHEYLAQLYSAMGDELRSERHLVTASQLSPNYPDLRYELAVLCSRTDRVEEAIAYLRSCLAIQPSFAMARFRLGECYVKLGQYDLAREHFLGLPKEVRNRPEVSSVIAACLAEAGAVE
jgi:tetratricopeptide (TPR) repeat protein